MSNIKRSFVPPNQSFFLFGPRGTGKSTLVKEFFPNSFYVDFLLPDWFRRLSSRPEELLDLLSGRIGSQTVVLDEVQRVPEVLSVIHKLIEEKKGFQFVLTGSSARKLKKAGINLLGGRALMKHLHPFTAPELKTLFNIDSAIQFGLVPVVLAGDNKEESLKAYIDLYIREEVKMEELTRNVGNFSRFLEIASFSHGSILNLSNIARECQIGRKTVESYIDIIVDLLIAFKVPIFSTKAKRVLSNHPKLYFFDPGVFRMLRPHGPLDKNSELAGPALEGLVAQQLRAWMDYKNMDAKLFFWRTLSGNEVDFIVYGENTFLAIEVKNTAIIHPKDTSALKAFGQDYPEAKRIFLYRGKETFTKDNILFQPCEEFLINLT
ncbi:ATP-binding protein [Candidatus Saganbacteria bacterium]|nr:ATP-binding protein [Candidatus Saganbacteria bacterium]